MDEHWNMSESEKRVAKMVAALARQSSSERISYEGLSEWNTIPYGEPCECRQNLLVIVDGKHSPADTLNQALKHLTRWCAGKTELALIYVEVSMKRWSKDWAIVEEEFSKVEDGGVELKIHFKR